MAFDLSSRSILSSCDLARFAAESLFDRVARALCRAECLPRKELYESWHVAKRFRRRVRGGRVLDLAAGHGLTAYLMLLLDETSESAIAVDVRVPASAERVARALCEQWPRLHGRVSFVADDLRSARGLPGEVVVAIHACGTLTDEALSIAIDRRAAVAVLPCCHDLKRCDLGGLSGWLDGPLAVDVARVQRLRAHGYDVSTSHIPQAVTPHHRLLMAQPNGPVSRGQGGAT